MKMKVKIKFAHVKYAKFLIPNIQQDYIIYAPIVIIIYVVYAKKSMMIHFILIF